MRVVFFLEGNIATGKSTLLTGLHAAVPCHIVEEPLATWQDTRDEDGTNLLEHFYQNPMRWAYAFQTYALVARVHALSRVDTSHDVIFVERSVDSDTLFASTAYTNGLLSDIEWSMYRRMLAWATEMASASRPFCKVHVYLRCPPDVCHERLMRRARGEEKQVTLAYLHQLHARHETQFTGPGTIVVDATCTEEEMVQQVLRALRGRTRERAGAGILSCAFAYFADWVTCALHQLVAQCDRVHAWLGRLATAVFGGEVVRAFVDVVLCQAISKKMLTALKNPLHGNPREPLR